jgi:hypothetical protein
VDIRTISLLHLKKVLQVEGVLVLFFVGVELFFTDKASISFASASIVLGTTRIATAMQSQPGFALREANNPEIAVEYLMKSMLLFSGI